MKTNLQFFAEDRTNMVSLLDIGTLIGSTAKIVEMGDGYKEITEDWRICADFRQIYGIDLSLDDMHWWMFNGLLWNMPYKQSSFQQVIEIRRKKITSKMGKEERQAIKEAQEMYALEQPEEKKEYTEDEKTKIDEYDQMMAEIRAKKKAEKELGLV